MGLFGKKDDQAKIKEELAKMQAYKAEAERQMALLQKRQEAYQQPPVELPVQLTPLQEMQKSIEESKAAVELPFDKGKVEKKQVEEKITLDQWLYTIVVNLEAINAKIDVLLPKQSKTHEEVRKKGGRPKKLQGKRQEEDSDSEEEVDESDSEK